MKNTLLTKPQNDALPFLALTLAVASARADSDNAVKLGNVGQPPDGAIVLSTGSPGEAVQYRYWDSLENCISQAQSFLWESDSPLATVGLYLEPIQSEHPWETGATQRYKLQIRTGDAPSMAGGTVVGEYEFSIGEQNVGTGGNWLTISFPPIKLTKGAWYSFQLFPVEMKEGQRILTGRNSGGYEGIWGFCRGKQQQPFTGGLEDRGDDLTFFLDSSR